MRHRPWIFFGIRSVLEHCQPSAQAFELRLWINACVDFGIGLGHPSLMFRSVRNRLWAIFGGSGSGSVLGVPSQEPRLARRGLWIILWISLGIGVGHSQASAHSCETQAVDQVVSQFRDRLWTFPA